MFPLKDNIPTDRPAIVTMALIAINVVVYFVLQKGGWSGGSDQVVIQWGAIPYEITHPGTACDVVDATLLRCADTDPNPLTSDPPAIATVFSSMFMHGSVLHLAGNMLFLWIFGNNVEDAMGRVKFVIFYLLGGLAAIAGQVAIDPDAIVPTIGASGAVAAVLGGYILLYPRARVITIIFIIFFFGLVELPAMVILGFWFLQQIAFGFWDISNPTGDGGGVAYFAHIGGFVFGLLAIKLFAGNTKDYTPPPKYPVY